MANNNHFTLTLDTLAPTSCSITRPGENIKENANLTIAATGATYMKVWFNENAEGSKSDAGYPTNWEAYATSKLTNFSADGTYYYHAVFMDDVNNETIVYNTELIRFDTTAPSVSNVYMQDKDSGSKIYTNDLTVNFGFTFSDALSGPDHAVVKGDDINDIQISSLGTSPYSGELTFKEGTESGTKTITVTVYDAAGNSASASGSIEYDPGTGNPVLSLLKTDGVTTLPAFINYHAIKIQLMSSETDIVGYKIWEGSSEPVDWVAPAGTEKYHTFPIVIDHTLSANDGEKTIHAKIKDKAGNIGVADDKSVTVDTVLPVVSISSDKTIISNVTGYNTAVLTLSGTDASAGVKSWDLLVGTTSIKGSLTNIPATFNLTSANAMVEGSNTVKLTVTDNAENTNEATVVVKLDTTAPSEVAIGTLNTWYKAAFDISASATDENTVKQYRVWTSTVADDTSVPAQTPVVDYTTKPQTISAANIKWALAQSDSNYMHLEAMDVVGNVAYAHAKFGYDDVKPTCSVAFTQSIYDSTSAHTNLTYSDNTSGVVKFKITGDITNPSTDWEAIAATRAVTLTTGDGYKKVKIMVIDNAGNESEWSTEAQCELDTTTPAGVITLWKPDDSALKEKHSSIAGFSAHIGYTETEDPVVTKIMYKLYGDFTYEAQSAQGITEAAAEWKELIVESGKDYMLISDMFCTSNPSAASVEKKIYLKVKDEVGHVSTQVYDSFYYDDTVPVVTVGAPDYNRISKINTLRRSNGSTTIEGKYADQVNFSFTVDDTIQAWKVCAYNDAEAAAKGSHEDAVIPSTAGSTNMSATGREESGAVSCMIKGADYEMAIGGKASTSGEFDGAHIVVVYAQNMAGLWSVAAVFTA